MHGAQVGALPGLREVAGGALGRRTGRRSRPSRPRRRRSPRSRPPRGAHGRSGACGAREQALSRASGLDPNPSRALRHGATLTPACDPARLDHRRLRGVHGRLGIRAGSDRRGPFARGIPRRCVRRLAPGTSPARRGLALALCTGLRARGRSAARRAAGLRSRGAGVPHPPHDRTSGSACSTGWAGRCSWPPWAWPRVDRRGRGAQHSRCARAARADPALGDPVRAERAPPAVGRRAEGARPLRRIPADQRPEPERGPAGFGRWRAIRTCAGPAAVR